MSAAVAGRQIRTVRELLPTAVAYARALGRTPGRNELMRKFGIGAAKAGDLLNEIEKHLQSEQAQEEGTAPVENAAPAYSSNGHGSGGLSNSYENWNPGSSSLPGSPGVSDSTVADEPRVDSGPVAPGGSGSGWSSVSPKVSDRMPDRAGSPKRKSLKVRTWPLMVIGASAMVAVWSGWIELGHLTGFGVVRPLPGIWDDFEVNTVITLPLGLEVYGAYAMQLWVSGRLRGFAKSFAAFTSVVALLLATSGQAGVHIMHAWNWTAAPWWVTAIVSALPVVTLGLATTLAHLVRTQAESDQEDET